MFTSTLLMAVLFALPAHAADLNVDELKTLATAEAVDNGLNVEHFLAVIDCENPTWNPRRQSDYVDSKGRREQSFGLAQINLPAHPDITVGDAKNPYFALHWMANEWKNDKAYEWSCWRRLYGR